MKEDGLGTLFLRQLVMAIPWGIIFLVVLFISAAAMKQQIKESIQYGVRMGVHETVSLSYQMVRPVKQNIKEGVEFVAKTAKNEIKAILNDPQIKQDLKEALEYGGEKLK
ncbi:MAG: hypothetical protein JRJ86_20505 [Deltaproteobacteria bacterium]|nr:hypothetical protein [Deltaproteobacteria bacterium]